MELARGRVEAFHLRKCVKSVADALQLTLPECQ